MGKISLIVMAAGMASRYGGNKQIDGVGPNGEALMEFSVTDAIRAGFERVIFIIKPQIREAMEKICARFTDRIEVCYAYQEFDSVPAKVPADRVKPFGTVHAVLCARDMVDGPFAVVNADDYYGVEPYAQMMGFLRAAAPEGEAAMVGYRLKNTVSRFGTVTRGICRVERGRLTGVDEVAKIQLLEDGRVVDLKDPEHPAELDRNALVSMNFWGFAASALEAMYRGFRRFLAGLGEDDLKAEYLLPVFVDEQIRSGEMDVRVLPTAAQWFGMTYREDRPRVSEALKKLCDEGVY